MTIKKKPVLTLYYKNHEETFGEHNMLHISKHNYDNIQTKMFKIRKA